MDGVKVLSCNGEPLLEACKWHAQLQPRSLTLLEGCCWSSLGVAGKFWFGLAGLGVFAWGVPALLPFNADPPAGT